MTDYIVALITCHSEEEAKKITGVLLDEKLVACVNMGGVESHFWWEGRKDNANEILLIAKTKASLFDKLAEAVKKHHSYDTPEIIALPIIAGNAKYLKWIDDSIK